MDEEELTRRSVSRLGSLPFVGREASLASVFETIEARSPIVLVGPSGAGKTRILNEVASRSATTIVVGRCSPESTNAAYAPFREIASKLSGMLDPASVVEAGDPRSRDLGVLFPHLPVDEAETGITDARRHGLWLAWAAYVRHLRSLVDVALVIEDLHWSDADSLALFRWMSAQPGEVATVATSRASFPSGGGSPRVVTLHPLLDSEIQTLIDAVDIEANGAAVLQATGGFPLAVEEWIRRFGGASGDQTAASSIDALAPEVRDVVVAAAVLGDRSDVATLGEAAGLDARVLRTRLQHAAAAGLVDLGSPGAVEFRHDTHRQAAIAALSPEQLATTHRAVLGALQSRHERDPDDLALLAHHAAEAARTGSHRPEAVALSIEAGNHALDVLLAPRTACRHYEIASDLAGLEDDEQLLLRAQLLLATALTRAADPAASDVVDDVLRLADRLGDHDAFVDATLLEPESSGPTLLPYRGNFAIVNRLRQSQRRLMPGDPTRGRVAAALALHQHASLSLVDYEDLVAVSEEVAAETAQHDLDAAAFVARHGMLRPAGTVQHRLAAARQRLASEPPTSRWHMQYFDIVVSSLFRLGRLREVDDEIKGLEARLRPLPVTGQWSMMRLRGAIAHASGDIATFEALSAEAMGLAEGTNFAAAAEMYFGFQMATLLRDRRMTGAAQAVLDSWVEADPTYLAFRASRAAQRADHGDLDAAAADLDLFFAQDLHDLSARVEGLPALELATVAAFLCERPGDCEKAWEALEPYKEEWVLVGAGSVLMGPVLQSMALASAGMGKHRRALSEIDRSISSTLEARTVLPYWHSLRDKGRIAARGGELALAREAYETARLRYEGAGLTAQAELCASEAEQLQHVSMSAMPPAGVAIEESQPRIERDNDVWHLHFGDEVAACRHTKGFTMLEALLRSPGVGIRCQELSALAEGLDPVSRSGERSSSQHSYAATAQELADPQALAAYRSRLDEIELALDIADRRDDASASERLATERTAILEELDRITGLGGRSRNMTDDHERARVRVTKAIRTAIRRVDEVAPGIGRHLAQTVQTGSLCTYVPRTGQPTRSR